jgi:hypothetical protein
MMDAGVLQLLLKIERLQTYLNGHSLRYSYILNHYPRGLSIKSGDMTFGIFI